MPSEAELRDISLRAMVLMLLGAIIAVPGTAFWLVGHRGAWTTVVVGLAIVAAGGFYFMSGKRYARGDAVGQHIFLGLAGAFFLAIAILAFVVLPQ